MSPFRRTRPLALALVLALSATASFAQVPAHDGPGPDATVACGDGPQQLGHLRLPEGRGPFPVAVAIHGGCFLDHVGEGSLTPAAAALVEDRIATWDVTYRRLGHDGAGWTGSFLDVGSAVDHLRVLAETYPLDLDRIALFGHSAGAPLAVWAAARSALPAASEIRGQNPLEVDAVLAIDGPLDLGAWASQGIDQQVCGEPVIASMLGGTPDEVPERYRQASPVDLPALDLEVFVLPAGMMEAFGGHVAIQARAADRGERVRIRPVPDSDHFQLITPGHPSWQAVRTTRLEALGLDS